MSRSTKPDSASTGMPRRPRRKASAPAFMEQPAVRRVSSACWITGSPKVAAERSAFSMIASSRMGLPSSVTAIAPAALSAG